MVFLCYTGSNLTKGTGDFMAKNIFSPDGGFYSWAAKISEFFLLSLLWLLFQLLVVTSVPASIALYDCTSRCLIRGEGGIYKRFFWTLWREMGRGNLIFLSWAVLVAVLVFGYSILYVKGQSDSIYALFSLVYLLTALIPLGIYCWLIPLESRYVYKFWELHRSALNYAIAYLPATGLLLLTLAVGVALLMLAPVLVLLLPGVISTVHAAIIEKKFALPDPDMQENG